MGVDIAGEVVVKCKMVLQGSGVAKLLLLAWSMWWYRTGDIGGCW